VVWRNLSEANDARNAMRITKTCLLLTLFAAQSQAFADTAARPKTGFFQSQPFDVVLDVNGELFTLQVPNSASSIRAEISDDDELLSVGYDRRSSVGWYSNDIVDFREQIEGALVQIRIYAIRGAFGGYNIPGVGNFPMRIYAQTKIDHNDDWIFEEVLQGFRDFSTPLIAQAVSPLWPHEWLLTGIYGPRLELETPLTLFSGVVGGTSFNISVREFGFRDWDDVVITDVPEPRTSCLLALSIVLGGFVLHRAQRGSRIHRNQCGQGGTVEQ
jgi:hypothetical protein